MKVMAELLVLHCFLVQKKMETLPIIVRPIIIRGMRPNSTLPEDTHKLRRKNAIPLELTNTMPGACELF